MPSSYNNEITSGLATQSEDTRQHNVKTTAQDVTTNHWPIMQLGAQFHVCKKLQVFSN